MAVRSSVEERNGHDCKQQRDQGKDLKGENVEVDGKGVNREGGRPASERTPG